MQVRVPNVRLKWSYIIAVISFLLNIIKNVTPMHVIWCADLQKKKKKTLIRRFFIEAYNMNDVLKNPLTAACMKRTAERKVIKLKKKKTLHYLL